MSSRMKFMILKCLSKNYNPGISLIKIDITIEMSPYFDMGIVFFFHFAMGIVDISQFLQDNTWKSSSSC